MNHDHPVYRWYVVVLLMVAYAFSFIDRTILNLLVEPIRADLGLSDTQISLLMGLAFAIFYTVAGLPIAYLADRYSRRTIIGVGITVWCFMTAACGLSRSFGQLFLARMGVGVGEAALSPAANSLISDSFPKEQLGRAIGVYAMGTVIGMGLALIIGGQAIATTMAFGTVELPVVGALRPWQIVFLLVGLPGLVIALLMTTVKEPRRRGLLHGDQVVSLLSTARFLGSRWRTYSAHFLGLSVTTIMAYGYVGWVPTFFIRTYGWSIEQIGLAFGLVMTFAGMAGVYLGGWLADYWQNRGVADAHWRVILVAVGILLPAYGLVTLMPSPGLALAFLIPGVIGGGMSTPPALAALMIITPNQMRAMAAALYFFVLSLIGLTVGPTAVALLTDYYFADEAALRYSMAIVAFVSWLLASLVLLVGWKHYRRSLDESRDWEQA